MMMLAVFRSRAQALDCVSLLRGGGIPAQAVATPSEAKVGCGLSAAFEENFLYRARSLMGRRAYSSFAGYMRKGANGFFYG